MEAAIHGGLSTRSECLRSGAVVSFVLTARKVDRFKEVAEQGGLVSFLYKEQDDE